MREEDVLWVTKGSFNISSGGILGHTTVAPPKTKTTARSSSLTVSYHIQHTPTVCLEEFLILTISRKISNPPGQVLGAGRNLCTKGLPITVHELIMSHSMEL
jgi:hypothetical protein